MSANATRSCTQNRLLAALPPTEYERLLPLLEPVQLSKGKIISEAGDPASHVYFPTNGVIALLLTTEDGEAIEVGMIGNEGTTGVPVIMHARKPLYRAVVQVPTEALHTTTSVIWDELKSAGRLNHILLCYEHSLFVQIAQSAVCSRFHTSEQRLCRWLLSTRDRVQTDTIELTQESISYMLGIQRSMVGTSASTLQRAGLISYGRGSITILDRKGLETAVCECYAIVKDQICRCGMA